MIQRLRSVKSNPARLQVVVLGIVVGLGLLVRLRAYWFNRSLWFDEAVMANYVIHQELMDLIFKPLAAGRLAPTGFLVVTKLLVSWISESEKVLRLLPILAGLLTALLALWIAQLVFSRLAARLLFVGLVAFSPIIIFYSVEFKQYILDASLGMLVLGIGIQLSLLNASLQARRDSLANLLTFTLAIVGIFGIWFSHPLVFFLFGVGLGLFIQAALQRKDAQKQKLFILWLMLIGAGWLVSFYFSYVTGLQGTVQDQNLHEIWAGGFAPFPTNNIPEMRWYLDTLLAAVHLAFQERFVAGPFALPGWYLRPNILFALLFVLGCMGLAKQQKWLTVMLALSGLATFAASALGIYPLRGRLFLFVVPIVYLSTSALIETLSKEKGKYVSWLLTAGLLLWVLIPTGQTFVKPTAFSEIRSVLQFLAANDSPGEDSIAISRWSLPAYQYYDTRFSLQDTPVYMIIPAANDPLAFLQAVCASPDPGKMWLLFSHRMAETPKLLDALRALTPQLTMDESPGAGVYFFNFSDPNVCKTVVSP